MEEIRTFLELTSVNSIMYIILGVVAFRELCELFTWLFNFLGLENKWTKKRNTESKMLQNHEQKLNQVSVDIKAINDKINVLSQMLVEMQNKADESKRAELKDRISQSYRYYNAKKQWNFMEKEAFDGLIRDYESHGGENSFVHSVCEPESCTWEIVD